MIHPDTELRLASEQIGFGVFATRPIPKGTIVWVLDDLDHRLNPGAVRRLGRRYEALLDRYSWLNAAGERVLCWDLARWVNHSCDANLLSSGWDFDITVRDVQAGEEITNDYGALNLEQSFACHCAAPECRGTIHPADFERLAASWDQRVREALAEVTRVPQALWTFVPNKRRVSAASRRPEEAPSVMRHRYHGAESSTRRVAQARP
jgi:hypothetical protein